MSETVLTDELWARLEPLMPVVQRRFRYPGRWRTDDGAALEGNLFVLRTGLSWQELPTDLFGASGSTCWRRLAEASANDRSRYMKIENSRPRPDSFGGCGLSMARCRLSARQRSR